MWGVQVYMTDWMEEMQVLGGGPTSGYGGSRWDMGSQWDVRCPIGDVGCPIECGVSQWEMWVPMVCGVSLSWMWASPVGCGVPQ